MKAPSEPLQPWSKEGTESWSWESTEFTSSVGQTGATKQLDCLLHHDKMPWPSHHGVKGGFAYPQGPLFLNLERL